VASFVLIVIAAVAAGPGLSRMNAVLTILALTAGAVYVAAGVAFYMLGARALPPGWPRVLAVVVHALVLLVTYGMMGVMALVLMNR